MSSDDITEAKRIMMEYRSVVERLNGISQTINNLSGIKDKILIDLDNIKKREKDFMDRCKEIYGDNSINILQELLEGAIQ